MIKQVFTEIREKILSLQDDQGNQLIKHFDLWNNNIASMAGNSPFEFPAVFIEFEPIEWATLMNKVQEGVLSFRLHIVTKWWGQTDSITPGEISLEQLAYLDLPGQIYKDLQGFALSLTGTLARTSTDFDHNHEDYIETIETYQCSIRDTQAYQEPFILNLQPKITT